MELPSKDSVIFLCDIESVKVAILKHLESKKMHENVVFYSPSRRDELVGYAHVIEVVTEDENKKVSIRNIGAEHSFLDEMIKKQKIQDIIERNRRNPGKMIEELDKLGVPDMDGILKSHAELAARNDADIKERFNAQCERAIQIVHSAGRPVKFSYICAELNQPVFRGLETILSQYLDKKRHKNKTYYSPKKV